MTNVWQKILFWLILAVSLGVRIGGLEIEPASINFDEASLGYNAYSLAKTGRDEFGNYLPVSLRSFNDYKPALYSYLSVPWVKLWGLNQTSTRMVSALAGVVSVFFLWQILKFYIPQGWWRVGILAILAFEPWRLHYSRTAFEANLGLGFFSGAMWLALRYRVEKKGRYLWWSIPWWVLSFYSYHGPRLAVPVILGLFLIDVLPVLWLGARWKKLIDWRVGIVLILVAMLVIPVFGGGDSGLVLTRFGQENIFTKFYPFAPKESWVPNLWGYVKSGYYLVGLMVGHVSSVVSPVNLSQRVYHWIKGSDMFIPGFNLLGYIESILVIGGLLVAIRRIKKVEYRYIIYWLVAGIAPSAVTWNWFHPLRALNVVPALELLVAIGAYRLFSRRKHGLMLLAIFFVVNVPFYVNNELVYSNWETHGEYQPGGFKEGVPFLNELAVNYEKVVIDSPQAQSYVFFAYYGSLSPQIIQKYNDVRVKPGERSDVNFDFEKYEFRRISMEMIVKSRKTIFWTRPDISEESLNSIAGVRVYPVYNVLYKVAYIVIKE